MKDFRLTFSDYMNAQNLFLGWKRWIMQLIFIPVILYLFFNKDIEIYSSSLISFILVLIALFLVPSLNRKRLRKVYLSQPSLQTKTSVSFNDEHIEWTADSGSDRISWREIAGYRIGKTIIVIFLTEKKMLPVPLSAFENSDEFNRFAGNLKKSGKV